MAVGFVKPLATNESVKPAGTVAAWVMRVLGVVSTKAATTRAIQVKIPDFCES